MSTVNEFRQALSEVPDVTPVHSYIAGVDTEFIHVASNLKQALGPDDYEGQWCFPVGSPGKLEYPPFAERIPALRWQRVNYVGLRYLLSGKYARHTGDDLDIPGYLDIGEPVRAPTFGHVTYANFVPDSTWGNVLVLRLDVGDNDYVYTRFGHLNSIEVNVGDTVVPGQLVAYVGNVGMPTAPHLHWDITKVNDPLLGGSPLNWPWDDLAFVQAHYIDPGTFILGKMAPPQNVEKVWRRTTSQLRVRSLPGTTSTVITVLELGVRIEVEVPTVLANGYNWTRITASPSDTRANGYYVASEFLGEDIEPVFTVWRRTITGLRARAIPDLDGSIVTVLNIGVRVEVETKTVLADGFNWAKVVSSPSDTRAEGAYVAVEFLGADVEPPKPEPLLRTRWAGLHTIGSISNNAADMLKKCSDAGVPVSAATVVVSGQAAQLVKTLSPKTLTIERPIHPDNLPTENGRVKFNRDWYNSYLDPIRSWLPYIDYVKFINEKWPGNKNTDMQVLEDFRDFYWDLGRACYADGIGYTVLDLAAGNMSDDRFPPELDQFSIMRPMLEWVATHGGILNYHCYNPLVPPYVYEPTFEPESWVLRPVYWLNKIPALKIVCCESLVPEWKDSSGQDADVRRCDIIKVMRQVDELWTGAIRSGRIRQEQFLGHCPFTDEPGQRWQNYNMNPFIPAQKQYLISG